MEVKIEKLESNSQVINIIQPKNENFKNSDFLLKYINRNKGVITNLLLKNGAVLFRNFQIKGQKEFLEIKETLAGTTSFNYIDGNSPRTKVNKDIYTSTEYPKEYSISLHSELSYSNKWPSKILFYCETPPESGGETPVADCRLILKKLKPEIVDKFERFGVKYTRYLKGSKGVGKSWMDTFETTNKNTVEKYCLENSIEFRWENDFLFLSQIGYGVAIHPITNEKVWFNQANQFHPSSLPKDVYDMLKMMKSKNPDKYPQYAYYGNGEEISENDLKEITNIHFENAVLFKWKQGDVLLLDNMLMSHGRMPFEGPRKICVGMY